MCWQLCRRVHVATVEISRDREARSDAKTAGQDAFWPDLAQPMELSASSVLAARSYPSRRGTHSALRKRGAETSHPI